MAVILPIITEFDGTGVNKAIKQFKQLETTSEKAQFAIKKAAIPAAAALTAVAGVIGKSISAASDMEESMSKVSVIFGEGSDSVNAFAKSAAKSMGQSRQSVLDAAGTFGTFGKAAGLNGQKLATFSNDFTTLASDLASFNNTSPEEAINAIGSALRGEAEPLRKFGVLLNDATLKAAALELGIYDGSGALTDQQKILAAQSVIYKQTTDAQGDFAKTSDGLANSSKVLKAQMENLQVSIGQAFLPVMLKVLPVVQKFAAWAEANPKLLTAVVVALGSLAVATLAVNAAMALNPAVLITAGIVALGVALVVAYKKFETFGTVVRTVVNGVADNFEFMANGFIKVINLIIKGINLVKTGKDIPSLGEISIGRMNAPSVDTPSMSIDNIGRAGAADRGVNITVNTGVGDPVAVGKGVVDALNAYKARTGSLASLLGT